MLSLWGHASASTMSYTWCNWKYCKTCGSTNKWFYTTAITNGKKVPWVSKECKECYLERISREHQKYHQSAEYKQKHKEYIKNYKFDRKLSDARYRMKKRKIRIMNQNRALIKGDLQ